MGTGTGGDQAASGDATSHSWQPTSTGRRPHFPQRAPGMKGLMSLPQAQSQKGPSAGGAEQAGQAFPGRRGAFSARPMFRASFHVVTQLTRTKKAMTPIQCDSSATATATSPTTPRSPTADATTKLPIRPIAYQRIALTIWPP